MAQEHHEDSHLFPCYAGHCWTIVIMVSTTSHMRLGSGWTIYHFTKRFVEFIETWQNFNILCEQFLGAYYQTFIEFMMDLKNKGTAVSVIGYNMRMTLNILFLLGYFFFKCNSNHFVKS